MADAIRDGVHETMWCRRPCSSVCATKCPFLQTELGSPLVADGIGDPADETSRWLGGRRSFCAHETETGLGPVSAASASLQFFPRRPRRRLTTFWLGAAWQSQAVRTFLMMNWKSISFNDRFLKTARTPSISYMRQAVFCWTGACLPEPASSSRRFSRSPANLAMLLLDQSTSLGFHLLLFR